MRLEMAGDGMMAGYDVREWMDGWMDDDGDGDVDADDDGVGHRQ